MFFLTDLILVNVDDSVLEQRSAYVDLRHHDPGHFVFELNRISDDEFRCRDLEFVLIARSPEAFCRGLCAALYKLPARTLFLPWWDYRAGTCAVPNPTKFFARSAGRGSLRHTPPQWCSVGVCTPWKGHRWDMPP